MSAATLFTDEDLDFLTFQKNSDSLELSSSNSDVNSTPSKSIMSTSSWSPSITFPESADMETFAPEELLGDLNLPSLGQGVESKSLISQILSGAYGHDQHFIQQISTADQYATNRGQSALKALGNELFATKEANNELRKEMNRLKELVSRIKDDLHDLNIPENVYVVLSKLHPSQLTIKEYACVRAAEIYLPLKREILVTKKQLEELHVALEMNTTSLQTQQEVLSRTKKQAQTAAETSRLDQMVAEDRIAKLITKLEAEIEKRKECEEKANRYDEVENLKLRQEMDSIRKLMEEQSEALRSLSTSEAQMKSLYDDVYRAKEMLQLDKTFLQKEVSDLVSKDHHNERIIDNQSLKISQLETKLLELTDQLAHIQHKSRTDFDERMEKEVQRLREDYTKELGSLKESSKDIIERENRVLRELKSNLQNEVDQLRRRMDDKEAELQRTYRELNAMNVTKDNEISSLRAELKMKSFEVTSLGATFEERMAQLKAANLELEVLREEVTVHRNAILRLESESNSKEMLLRENLSRAYETIRAYELLLHDNNGHSAPAEDMNSPTSLLANQTAWSTSFQSPPLPITVLASDPRKLRQLLDSSEKNSQKIVALESKVREQQKLIQDYEKQQTELTLKLDRANRCMSLMNQPSKYLLSRLNEMEVEHGVMEKRLKELEYENAEAAKIKASLELEISQLKERLQLLLSQRNEIHSLKAMLEALRQEESQESEDDGSDAEEDDEKHVPPPTLTFPQSIPEFTPMKTSNQNESFPPFTPSHQSLLKEPRTPLSPSSTVVMEATRPVSATDLGLSPAAMRSMLERTHPTPSKKRITES